MIQALRTQQLTEQDPVEISPPKLVFELEPASKVFFRNLRDLVASPEKERLRLTSWPGTFWPDVFVKRGLPWKGFLESSVVHGLVVAALIASSALFPQPTRVVDPVPFRKEDVVYYSPEEYLAPLDTGSAKVHLAQKGDPEKAPQPILSVPPEADNRKQTIVTPPKLKLNQDVPLPNIVAMADTNPMVPNAERKVSDLRVPELPTPVVAPTPDANLQVSRQAPSLGAQVVSPAPDVTAGMVRRDPLAPQPAIVEPPPDVNAKAITRRGDINIGSAQVVQPAPQLPMPQQRAVPQIGGSLGSTAVVPPPPTVTQGSASSSSGNRLVALNVHPSAPAVVNPPSGNRRGTFAASPDGKNGASGTPEQSNGSTDRSVIAGGGTKDLPPGLKVETPPVKPSGLPSGSSSAGNTSLIADARAPRVSSSPQPPASTVVAPSELEKEVFGDRRLYSMTLNMPNLNSGGGSWIIRFAELNQNENKGELLAPEATQKVDPGYPVELMRHNVHGTVTLYAVIASDGTVSNIRVLRGVDDRLDAYAVSALSRWKFRPAVKNGAAVPLEAVVMIPFRPARF